MSNVRPGMLAVVVRVPGHAPMTPEIIDRIVYVERACKSAEMFYAVDGLQIPFVDKGGSDIPIWVISAKEPLPYPVNMAGGTQEKAMVYERPLMDTFLRPLLDPDLGINEEEVRELYASKEMEESFQ